LALKESTPDATGHRSLNWLAEFQRFDFEDVSGIRIR